MNRLLVPARWLLGYEGIPVMSRPTFRRELIGQFLAAIGTGAMLPGLTQLFALKTLQGPDWVAPVLLAGMPAGNFFATFISQYLERRRRIPSLIVARIGMALAFVAIAFLPASRASVWPYVLLLMLPALLAAAILSIQSSIRHSNYSDRVRGSVLSRLIIVRMGVIIVTVKLAGLGLDRWSQAHRLIYPLAAVAMLASAYAYSRIRVRREPQLLRKGAARPFHLFAGFRLLWQDRAFGLYMLFQMLSGGANLMVAPAIVLWLIKVMKVSYMTGTDALVLVPLGVALLGLPLAGKLFDRMGVARFRGLGAAAWGLGRCTLFVAALTGSWSLVLVAFAFQGLGFSGGSLAWSIGHTRFAPPDKTQTYMGIHLTLQGIRGLIMPFVGAWLYHLPAIGTRLFLLAGMLHLAGSLGFFLIKPHKAERQMFRARQGPFA